jgi:hypothetical protein
MIIPFSVSFKCSKKEAVVLGTLISKMGITKRLILGLRS